MTATQLVGAMTVAAGATKTRTKVDLGRFGMGLKSASFSQAYQLTATTTADGATWNTRTWDLDTVISSGEWRLLRGTDPDTEELLEKIRSQYGRGTIVIWRQLRRYRAAADTADTQKQFYAEKERTRGHLGMVFERFLRRGLRLSVAGEPVVPWDPFLKNEQYTRALPVERLPINGAVVQVEAYVLPHPKRLGTEHHELAGGPGGWLDQQGFYIYRRGRLIVAGDWLGLRGLRRDEKYSLARIEVEVPAEIDSDWQVDVRKSSVVPPVALRNHLLRIGQMARTEAASVISHRGQMTVRRHSADFVYAWKIDRTGDQVRCRVNRDHPLVRQVLRPGTGVSDDARALIRFLEETLPIAGL
jgi:hypothetical protein